MLKNFVYLNLWLHLELNMMRLVGKLRKFILSLTAIAIKRVYNFQTINPPTADHLVKNI